MIKIYPSLMAADQLDLKHEIETLDAHCVGFHLDLMDGHFVPNLAMSPEVINAVDRASQNPVWVHIMADNPRRWIDRLIIKEKSIVSIHIETKNEITESINDIRKKNWLPSLAINPKTAVFELLPFIDQHISQILIMSVEPGFSGQKFMPEVLKKIDVLIDLKYRENFPFTIALDGGIGPAVIPQLSSLEVSSIAASRSIFNHKDRLQNLMQLQKT